MERSPVPQGSKDLDRSRKLAIVEAPTILDRCRLMVSAALGVPVKMTVNMTVNLRRYEASNKSDKDLPKLLMIEWE
jgi:hypothetical protein